MNNFLEWTDEAKQDFQNRLLVWFERYKRDLPWRHTTDPYRIWISEIILQQTRVAQGLAYYERFISAFPDVRSLAAADEEEVLKLWQGLGYYSRARNLHAAARQIVAEHGGVFPTRYEEVICLRGIGEYTASAIVSFACNQPRAVVDGNVFRVLARLFGIETPIDTSRGKAEFAHIATRLLNAKQPSAHNQAMMEFGALQCVPVSPDCKACPLADYCFAVYSNRVSDFPVKSLKTKTQERYFYYFFVRLGNDTYLRKRTEQGIWKNLYEFPLIETETELTTAELFECTEFRELTGGVEQIEILSESAVMKHVLSHRIIFARFYTLIISNESAVLSACTRLPLDKIDDFPVSRLMELFVKKIK